MKEYNSMHRENSCIGNEGVNQRKLCINALVLSTIPRGGTMFTLTEFL